MKKRLAFAVDVISSWRKYSVFLNGFTITWLFLYEILNCDHYWKLSISKSSWQKHYAKFNTSKRLAYSELKKLVYKKEKTTLITVNRKLSKASKAFRSSSQAVITNLEKCSATINGNSVLFLKQLSAKMFW